MSPRTYSSEEMIAHLVGFNTVSHLSNLELVSFIKDYLEGFGIPVHLQYDETGEKAGIYASIGPDMEGGIVLSGHTDVVPVDGQNWGTDPFHLTKKDGKLYGRGTTDMKSFSAIALAKLPEMLAQPLKTPIHFALSYDEEIGCIGVRPLIADILKHFPKPKIVLVGEPTNMTVVNAHKSIHAFHTIFTGYEAHSSMTHLGVNAVQFAGEFIAEINRIDDELREKGSTSSRFEPPYTSIHIGTIHGGTALNIIPKSCKLHWEIRALPDQNVDDITDRLQDFCETHLLPRMQDISPETGIETIKINEVPPLVSEPGSPAETLCLSLAQSNDTYAVSYGTEAGLFQREDIPTVICGPGDIEQAHKPNEFITLEQIELCEKFIDRLIESCRQ